MSIKNPTSILAGAAFTISMRWTDRLIGLVSMLILARLLVPEDFGIIAMGSVVVGLLGVLFDLGVNVALIQNRDATQAHYNTAWTIRLLQSTATACMIFIGAPLAGVYFDDPRVVPVLQVMSIGLVLAGLENIGVITFQKNMQFGLDFRFMFLKRIAGFLTTVTVAWLLRSYWALVIGALTGRVLGVILSYYLHPMRPRLSLEKFREIFAISQWMLVRSIGAYLDNNLHKILVGRRSGTSIMGGYQLASEISAMPSTELLTPLNRVLFPAFVQAKADLPDLKRLFLLAQGVQTLIGVPAAIGLALVAHEAVLLLLGEKWMLAVPFVQLLAVAHVVQAITASGSYVMVTLGQVRNVALLAWFQVAVLATGAFAIVPQSSAIEIATLRLATVLVGVLLALWLLLRTLQNLSTLEIVRTIARPLIGAGTMAAVIVFAFRDVDLPVLATLILKITTGCIVYGGTVMMIWRIAGKPEGAESYILDKAGLLWNARRKLTGSSR